jgi:hypothetical protein
MSLFKQLTRLSVTAMDVAHAREFYSDTLGLEEIPRPAFNFPGIWYSLDGDLQLHISLNDQLVRPAIEREKIEARYPHFAPWTAGSGPAALARATPRARSGGGPWERSFSRYPWQDDAMLPHPLRPVPDFLYGTEPGVSLQSVMRRWVATATTRPFALIAMRHTGSGSGSTAAGSPEAMVCSTTPSDPLTAR